MPSDWVALVLLPLLWIVLLPLLYIGAAAGAVWFMRRYPLFDDPMPSRRARRRARDRRPTVIR